MSFERAVAELVAGCRGARGAAIVDPDGIPVAMEPAESQLEFMGAELASVLRAVNQSGRELQHGALQQLTVVAASAVVVLTVISAGYFLLLVLDRDAPVGRARFLSRVAGSRLYTEFI